MKYPRTLQALLALSSWTLLSLSAGGAAAAEPCGDQMCPDGFSCQTSVGFDCAPCMDGAECPPCEPFEHSFCGRASCAADSDCGAEMVCGTFTSTACSGSTGCDAESECPPPEPSVCTSTETRQCAFRHELPCTVNADCGAGYECIESQSCWCSGGAAPVPGGAGSTDDPPAPSEPPQCGCEPSGEFHCRVIEIPCSTDADCALGFTCADNGAGACWVSPDGSSGCTPADPPRLCQPPASHGGEAVPDGGSSPPAGNSGPDVPNPDQPEDDGASDPDDEPDEAVPGRPHRGHRHRRNHHRPSTGHRSLPGWGNCSMQLAGAGETSPAWALLALGAVGLVHARRRQR